MIGLTQSQLIVINDSSANASNSIANSGSNMSDHDQLLKMSQQNKKIDNKGPTDRLISESLEEKLL